MSHLISNIPYFKCWVRKEFTCNHNDYHGEYLHALAIAVNTIPDRSLSFQVVFTGCERHLEEEETPNVHGGAMWARMPIQALVADVETESDEWPERMEDHICQPWDCESRHHEVIVLDRVSSSPWVAKVNHEFYEARYIFTVDYTDHQIADSPDQHKQSHVLYLTEGPWEGNIIALPNNRARATSPALWDTGEGAPDFKPSQYVHSAERHSSYTDPNITFDNLYSEGVDE
jgi:hypothetical protein